MRRFMLAVAFLLILPSLSFAGPIAYVFGGHVTDIGWGVPEAWAPFDLAIGDSFVGVALFRDGLPAPGCYGGPCYDVWPGDDILLFFEHGTMRLPPGSGGGNDGARIAEDGRIEAGFGYGAGIFSPSVAPTLLDLGSNLVLDPSSPANPGSFAFFWDSAPCPSDSIFSGRSICDGVLAGPIDYVRVVPVPESTSPLLVGAALFGLARIRRARK